MLQLDLHENMTKAEEIKVMYDFYQALPKDSYLVELLYGLSDYVHIEISNDCCEGIVHVLDCKRDEIVKLERENGLLNERFEGQAGNIKKLQEKIKEMEEEHRKEKEQLSSTVMDLRNKLNQSVEENCNLYEELERKDNQILHLKAKLYDFIANEEKDEWHNSNND